MWVFRGQQLAALITIGLCGVAPAAAQGRLELQQTRYELRSGKPAPLAASRETVDFLLSATTRSVQVDGTPQAGLVVGPNRAHDQMLLAASARLKPGTHTVKLSATSPSGEEREVALDVVVDALPTVPSGSTRPPVVLLNGWEVGYTGTCNIAADSLDTFGNLGSYLVSDGVPVVYLFDNCAEDPDEPIEVLGNDLSVFLNSIQYDNGSPVEQIDLVAHSMGGLIVRAYLSGLQPQAGVVLTPPANTLVHKLVMIAVPNFGSFVAGTYSINLAAGTQSGELIPGSSFLWNVGTWNQFGDDLRGVNTIAVVGNAGVYNQSVANASDGVVSETSASLQFVAQQTSVTRIVPYCHVDPDVWVNTVVLGAYQCDAPGIANVSSTSQLTGQIVRSFLAGNTNWTTIGSSPTTDTFLSQDGGVFFGLLNSNGTYVTDISAVQWGNVALTNGGDTDTIFYDDLVFGSAAYVATSQSLGTVTCPSSLDPVGYIAVTRCKFNATIASVSPEAKVSGRVVAAGASLTINSSMGAGMGTFGTTKCATCKVTAAPASGASGTQTLTVTSWSNTAITVTLPATLSGLQTLTVYDANSNDSINVLVVSATPAIAVSPASLQFAYTAGGAAPAAQNLAITNSGNGTLAWTATSSASWLMVTPASGTAPSTLSVSVSPSGMSAGSYQGTIQLSASGASNTPLSVTVMLTVAATPATLAVAPQTLAFQYTLGAAAPAAQNVAITNAGSGALTWTASDSDSWVTLAPASGTAPGTLAISVNPSAMAAGSYSSNVQITAAGAAGSPAVVAVTLVVQAASGTNITAVLNGGSFQPGFASATWVSIFGTNLASTTYTWQSSDFVNGALPITLDGVSVTINGMPAYVGYISPTQINVLAPDDTAVGAVPVQVTSGQVQSNSITAQKAQFAPSFFTLNGGPYVVAQHADYTLVGSANLLPGVVTSPAVPGEVIQIYATGFGPTSPALPTGQLVTTPSVLANQAQVTIGGVSATVEFAGLVESGLYQLNVMVPSLPNGDAAVTATIGGVQTQTGVLVTVQQ